MVRLDMAYKARPIADRFWEKVDKSGECWLWNAAKYPTGYGMFVVRKGDSPQGAHRIAYRLAFGEIPEGMQICHKCDNRPCVRPDHLFAGTAKDNADDRQSKGRWEYTPRNQFGERNPNSLLTDAEVSSMLADLARGEGPVDVAARYGIAYKTLWAIRRRKTPVR